MQNQFRGIGQQIVNLIADGRGGLAVKAALKSGDVATALYIALKLRLSPAEYSDALLSYEELAPEPAEDANNVLTGVRDIA